MNQIKIDGMTMNILIQIQQLTSILYTIKSLYYI